MPLLYQPKVLSFLPSSKNLFRFHPHAAIPLIPMYLNIQNLCYYFHILAEYVPLSLILRYWNLILLFPPLPQVQFPQNKNLVFLQAAFDTPIRLKSTFQSK